MPKLLLTLCTFTCFSVWRVGGDSGCPATPGDQPRGWVLIIRTLDEHYHTLGTQLRGGIRGMFHNISGPPRSHWGRVENKRSSSMLIYPARCPEIYIHKFPPFPAPLHALLWCVTLLVFVPSNRLGLSSQSAEERRERPAQGQRFVTLGRDNTTALITKQRSVVNTETSQSL
jgi:hypothetical protein